MIRQQSKDLYFAANRMLVLPNTWWARWRYRNPPADGYRINLGSGRDYRAGLLNVDGNIACRKDLWIDLRNRLPFPDRSASLVFCCHMLEHLFPDDAIRLLAEVRRILRDDGVARIATPGMEYAMDIARGGTIMQFPRPFEDTLGQVVNYLFCEGQHKYAYSFGVMQDFARQAGFTRIRHYSAEHGVTPATYHGVAVGSEPGGSLVVELQR